MTSKMPAVVELKAMDGMKDLPVVIRQRTETTKERCLYSEPLVVFGILLLVALSTASVVLASMVYHNQIQECPAPPSPPKPHTDTFAARPIHSQENKKTSKGVPLPKGKAPKDGKNNMNKEFMPRPTNSKYSK